MIRSVQGLGPVGGGRQREIEAFPIYKILTDLSDSFEAFPVYVHQADFRPPQQTAAEHIAHGAQTELGAARPDQNQFHSGVLLAISP
jgi:hypothetical protein